METIFLKLGGSLITDKDAAYTAKTELLNQLAEVIDQSYQCGKYRLLLGHGSGSFGHQAAKKFGTRNGVQTKEDWFGFLEVWKQARALNQIVIDTLSSAGLPVLSFPPVSSVLSDQQEVIHWNTQPIEYALSKGIIPVIYGDVIFDHSMQGTILSTEELFLALANTIAPDRVLIAGIEKGVWQDFPVCTTLREKITPAIYDDKDNHLLGSKAVDVTGGMAEKVNQMLNLVQLHPQTNVQIFSAENPQDLSSALSGERIGTIIEND
jgi:isopentenyl phosphate kinase